MMQRWTRGGIAVLASTLLVTACGSSSDSSPDVEATAPEGFAATPNYLSSLAERSAAESFRFSHTMEFPGVAPATTVGEGAVDGDVSEFIADPGQLDMRLFDDGRDNVYLQVPFLLDIPDHQLDAMHSELKGLLEPTDGWLMIEREQMTGYTTEEANEIAGSSPQQQDPMAAVGVVANAEDAEELEAREIQGEEMVGISAVVSFVELLGAEGTDPEGFAELMSSSFDGMLQGSTMPADVADSFVETMFDVMVDADMSVEVWVDEAGYLRQMGYTIDVAQIVDETANQIEGFDLPALPPSMSTRTTMDFYDHGEDFDLEPPEEAADLTERPELFDVWSLMALVAPTPAPGGAPMAPS